MKLGKNDLLRLDRSGAQRQVTETEAQPSTKINYKHTFVDGDIMKLIFVLHSAGMSTLHINEWRKSQMPLNEYLQFKKRSGRYTKYTDAQRLEMLKMLESGLPYPAIGKEMAKRYKHMDKYRVEIYLRTFVKRASNMKLTKYDVPIGSLSCTADRMPNTIKTHLEQSEIIGGRMSNRKYKYHHRAIDVMPLQKVLGLAGMTPGDIKYWRYSKMPLDEYRKHGKKGKTRVYQPVQTEEMLELVRNGHSYLTVGKMMAKKYPNMEPKKVKNHIAQVIKQMKKVGEWPNP